WTEGLASSDGGTRAVGVIIALWLVWRSLATVVSIAPLQSILGSFGRGMGLITACSAALLFVIVWTECRQAPAVRTPVDDALLGSVPVCLLALGQAAGWDWLPRPWDPAVATLNVRSTFGSHIFLGSYLVVLIPLASARLEGAVRERLEAGRWEV